MAEAKTPAAAQKAATKAAAAPKKSTTAKPAAAKPIVKKAATKVAVPKKTATPKKAAGKSGSLSPEERYKWVETRAYFIAESDNFKGDPQTYWAQAEIQIAAVLK